MGQVLSEPTLLDDEKYKKRLLRIYPDALGGEMEGRGITLEANEIKLDWLIIKAICDWGEKKNELGEGVKERDQKIAAKNSTEFLKYVIENGLGQYVMNKRNKT